MEFGYLQLSLFHQQLSEVVVGMGVVGRMATALRRCSNALAVCPWSANARPRLLWAREDKGLTFRVWLPKCRRVLPDSGLGQGSLAQHQGNHSGAGGREC